MKAKLIKKDSELVKPESKLAAEKTAKPVSLAKAVYDKVAQRRTADVRPRAAFDGLFAEAGGEQ